MQFLEIFLSPVYGVLTHKCEQSSNYYVISLYEHLLLCMNFKGRYRVMDAQYIRRYVELFPGESKHIFPNSLFK